ncbi:unnamed protein product [Linum trigynum]|uniref:Uncharacterized protein n=1 Tax=Linum trigynum TaxID=586398 RepID=A0AAV2CUH0_9ROSI
MVEDDGPRPYPFFLILYLINLPPILSVGRPKEVEEATFHSVRLPPTLFQNNFHSVRDMLQLLGQWLCREKRSSKSSGASGESGGDCSCSSYAASKRSFD